MIKISNLIISLQNAILANKPKITVKNSKYIENFLRILVDYQYIATYSKNKKGKIDIFLSFSDKGYKILSLTPMGMPSKPLYYTAQQLWEYERSIGLLVLNTSKGIMPHKTALAVGIGGQALCYIL